MLYNSRLKFRPSAKVGLFISMKALLTAFSLVLCPIAIEASLTADLLDFQVDLKNPVFEKGVISTEEGGVITAEGIRIQARKIAYTNCIENGITIRKIKAEGDLLLEYGDQAFVGDKLEYDFTTHSGVIEGGKTHVEMWFIGGEKIYLQEDGSYYILNAYITTWASDNPLWEVHAGKIRISQDKLLSARNLRFNFARLPFFWLPSFKANLKAVKKPPVRFKVRWDKSLGPRISARYRVYSWESLDIFLRGDYRVGKGGGVALETEYFPEDQLTEFVTRSYGSINDKSTPTIHNLEQFRLQGLFKTQSRDDRTHVHLVYDAMRSQKMIDEFKSDDFEIDTKKRTRLIVNHREDNSFMNLSVQPRINPWQSLNQELPYLSLGIRPFTFGSSGIIMQNWTNASYLDYVYSHNLRNYLHQTHAVRLQTNNSIYRPFRAGPVMMTPDIGIIAIFYNNNPFRHSIGQAVGTYGFLTNTKLQRQFSKFEHIIEPYLSFRGLTKPTAPSRRLFIFSIEDGYHSINALRFGVVNDLCLRTSIDPPHLSADLYAYAFFGDRSQLSTIPRLYLDLTSELPTCFSTLGFVWNLQKHLIDRINARTSWTVSKRFAINVEFRHRSRFDWRKANYDNYILDVSRSFHELLQSPLSDGRDTLLGELQYNLHPLWTMHVAGHFGWGRGEEPSYHSAKVDLHTTIVTGWRLRVSAEVNAGDMRFTTGMEVIKY